MKPLAKQGFQIHPSADLHVLFKGTALYIDGQHCPPDLKGRENNENLTNNGEKETEMHNSLLKTNA